jgi:phytoene dehydrogenase-like protein
VNGRFILHPMEALDFETIVIGAGVSGLAAGRSLAKAGHSVAVLEARNRLGGRVLTEHVPVAATVEPIAVELGAEFVHGLPQESWRLINEAGLAVYEILGTHVRSVGGRLEVPGLQDDGSTDVLQRMIEWSAQRPGDQDSTFTGFLESSPVKQGAAPRDMWKASTPRTAT